MTRHCVRLEVDELQQDQWSDAANAAAAAVAVRARQMGLCSFLVQHLMFSAAVPLRFAVDEVLKLLHCDLAFITGGQAARVQAVCCDVGSPSCTESFHTFLHRGLCIRKTTSTEHGLKWGGSPSSTKGGEELPT